MLVHQDINLINKLLTLYPKEVDIFIHVDFKSSISISDIVKLPNIKSIIKKIKCEWGKMSIVDAELELIKEAGLNYDYYHLTCGNCLPLCKQQDLDKLIYPKCYIRATGGPGWFFGSQWWSLSKFITSWILCNINMIKSKNFELPKGVVPDEWLLQTLIYKNFPNLVTQDNKRFVEIEGNHARYITKNDKLDGYLFARKVDMSWF